MIPLKDTPYSLNIESEKKLIEKIRALESRVVLLRNSGVLTEKTIQKYYGEKRFEIIAESNAIEGSTLSVGETELAIVKGITITGHDPAYIKDAISLDKALTKLVELAKNKQACVDNYELNTIHNLILEDQNGAGIFRTEPVRISGANHTPPQTHSKVLDAMCEWSDWSKNHRETSCLIRAVVLHAWLVHIHPYIDGNGRVARAITNLDLIRNGFPPITIKKKDRDVYIDALSYSDEAGDIMPLFELFLGKINDSLLGLEIIAKQEDGYNPIAEKLKEAHKKQLRIWENSITLLASSLDYVAEHEYQENNINIKIKKYDITLDIEDFEKVCRGESPSQSWAFKLDITVPGFSTKMYLAWVGSRSFKLQKYLDDEKGPSIFWSIKNTEEYPTWIIDQNFTLAKELTIKNGNGDIWFMLTGKNRVKKITPMELGKAILKEIVDQLVT